MKKRRVWLILGILSIAGVAGGLVFGGKLFPGAPSQAGGASTYATVAVTRGDIVSTVSASGQLEPNTTVTVRPDSNMSTREGPVRGGGHQSAGIRGCHGRL